MKKLITISAILLSLFSFAQDTLMTFDFTDGKYDSTIFTNLKDFKPFLATDRGQSFLVLQSPSSDYGPFSIKLELDTTFNKVYDSIAIRVEKGDNWTRQSNLNSSHTMQYITKNSNNSYSTIYEMTHIPSSRNVFWNDRTQSACYNCNSFTTAYTSYKYISDIRIKINTFKKDDHYSNEIPPYLSEIWTSEYENVYHEPYNGTTSYSYFFRAGENPTKKGVDDFCYLVASDIGRNEFDYNIAFDCIYQNQQNAFKADDFSFTFSVEEIHIIGYKSNITSTNKAINSNNSKEPIKYLNTQGIEIKKENLQPNTFYISIYRDGQKEKFMIVE